MGKTKNREAGENSAKGNRLQKGRAIKFLLESVNNKDIFEFRAYLEYQGDITKVGVDHSGCAEEFIEEDKNYDTNSAFTINSKEIYNTLHIFLDLWIQKRFSNSCLFGFYSTNKIGKEHLVGDLKKCFESIGILETLVNKNYNPEQLSYISGIVISKYEEEYSNIEGNGKIEIIKNLTEGQWNTFFENIDWSFNSDAPNKLEIELIEKIKACKHYNSIHHAGKEDILLSCLFNEIDKKQLTRDFIEKSMNASDIELIFMKVGAFSSDKEEDPIGDMWQKVNYPNDKRNLIEKIKVVCPSFNTKKLEGLSQRACKGKIYEDKSANKKNFLATKYRIYEKSETLFLKFREKERNESSILEFLDEASIIIKETLDDLNSLYYQKYNKMDIIESILIDLIDSCYLNFDEI